jgi:hypothetical protein
VVVADSVALPGAEAGGARVGATVGEIVERPESYFGQLVTVDGEVTELVGRGSFVLDDELLVVPVPAARLGGLDEGDGVEVTGGVQRFDVAVFEGMIGADLADDEFGEWEGEPAVVARVNSVPG